MSLARSLRVTLVLLVLLSARPITAQAPLRDSTAVAVRAERLPVLDDDGNVIPENLIVATMRPGGGKIWRPVFGVVAGLLLFGLTNANDAACDIYDPCTPKEEWRSKYAPWTGLAVGLMIGFAIPDGSINRWKAVEILRAERRAKKAARTP